MEKKLRQLFGKRESLEERLKRESNLIRGSLLEELRREKNKTGIDSLRDLVKKHQLFGKSESLEEMLKRESIRVGGAPLEKLRHESKTGIDWLRDLVKKMPKTTVKMPDLPTLDYEELLRRYRQ